MHPYEPSNRTIAGDYLEAVVSGRHQPLSEGNSLGLIGVEKRQVGAAVQHCS
jgi:hypothetical protein